jgi:hypothetical protein
LCAELVARLRPIEGSARTEYTDLLAKSGRSDG